MTYKTDSECRKDWIEAINKRWKERGFEISPKNADKFDKEDLEFWYSQRRADFTAFREKVEEMKMEIDLNEDPQVYPEHEYVIEIYKKASKWVLQDLLAWIDSLEREGK